MPPGLGNKTAGSHRVTAARPYGLVAVTAKLSQPPTRPPKATQMESVTILQDSADGGSAAYLSIRSDGDIVAARKRARAYALALGFSSPEATLVATAISELARNIVEYAQQGEIALHPIERDGRSGLLVVASDRGPGMPEVQNPGGLGLRAIKRLMDDVQLQSMAGQGTTVRVTRWKPLA